METKTENISPADGSASLRCSAWLAGLSEIGELMRTQDNLCTADVFFLVQEKTSG